MTQTGLQEVAAFDTRDGVYDCAWSEVSFLNQCLPTALACSNMVLVSCDQLHATTICWPTAQQHQSVFVLPGAFLSPFDVHLGPCASSIMQRITNLPDVMKLVHRPACYLMQENENILASACGDGSIKVWDVAAPPDVNPLRSLEEHTREVSTLAGSMTKCAMSQVSARSSCTEAQKELSLVCEWGGRGGGSSRNASSLSAALSSTSELPVPLLDQ